MRRLLARRWDLVDGLYDTLDNIIYVGKVALQLTASWPLEDLNALALLHFLGEVKGSHVWTTPRSVHSEETEARHGQTIDVLITMSDQLVRLLRCGVQTGRIVYSVAL